MAVWFSLIVVLAEKSLVAGLVDATSGEADVSDFVNDSGRVACCDSGLFISVDISKIVSDSLTDSDFDLAVSVVRSSINSVVKLVDSISDLVVD